MQFNILTTFATLCLSLAVSAAPTEVTSSSSLTASGFESSAEFENIGAIFNSLTSIQREDAVQRVHSVIQFVVEKDQNTTNAWMIDLKTGRGSITMPGNTSELSDIDFNVKDVDMARMARGDDLDTLYTEKKVHIFNAKIRYFYLLRI